MPAGIRLCGPPRSVLAAFLVSVALASVLSACGSSSSSSSPTSAASAASSQNADAVARARVHAANCIRAQGIDIPDLTPGSGRILNALRILNSYPQAKVQAALKACATPIKQAFPDIASLTPQQLAQRRQEATDFAACMRSHGIAFPDPSTATSNPSGFLNALRSIDINSPAYKAAAPSCRAQALKDAGA
jgi:hypothetical protein